MSAIEDFLAYELFGIDVLTYVLAFLSILAGFVMKRVIVVVLQRLIAAAEKSRIVYDETILDAAVRPAMWGCVLGGIWLACAILPLPSEPVDVERFVMSTLKGFSIALLLWFGLRLVDRLCEHWLAISKTTDSKLDDQIVPIVRSSTKVFLVVIGAILILQNLGYSVTSLVAGVGIGGAALAFASKDTLSNLFGSLVVFFDRPFQIGDWIEMGDVEGTVEEVGLRTTRVRTFANSQITLPNMLFTTSAINNWSRMKKRRIKMSVGLTYGATPEQMERAVEAIRDIIRTDEAFHHDFFIVNFDTMGPHSLDIFVYCFTVTTNWAEFLDAKQRFLLQIMQRMKEIGVDFAFPTQTVHVESMPGEPKSLLAQRPR